ncbi:MAG: hypothetical protein KDK45_19265, partial [Leptospiraceae bacterium]|nr:hypothetical protein [Leptospiraceae bacterium]
IYVQKTSQFLKISTLDLVIGFIDVNPKDLENHNSIDFTSSSQLLVLNRKKEELSKFLLASNGKVAPFDSKTGGINPMLNFKLKLLKGSYVTAMAAFDALNSQLQGLLSSDMKSLSEKAELEEDASFQASYGHGVLTFKDDIRLPTKHYTMSLKKESWIQVTNNQHLFHADMTFSRNDSKPLIDSIQTSLKTAQLSEENLKKIQDKILSGFIKEDMLFLTFKSSGNVANPDLSIVSPLPSLKDILKDALSEGLKDKFQEELKKNLPGVDSLKKLF